jgi:putative FmdB family regulatory protein
MSTYDFVCLECGGTFELDLADEPASGSVACPVCRSTVVRQTFASYLRHGLARRKDIEELRDCHFG